jgi:GH15 family glucan-1,4-alpha-glucosidase
LSAGRECLASSRGSPLDIRDYGIIGDGRSAALVSRNGSVDWLCWPRFDSPSLFAAILDADKGGCWSITPTAPFRVRRSYTGRSNVLVTVFETSDGEARLTDLMPVYSEEDKRCLPVPEHELLRVVECVRGSVELETTYQPRPNYGRKLVALRPTRALGLRIEDGRRLYTLRSNHPPALVAPADATGRFVLRAGERAAFSLTFDHDAPATFPPLGDETQARVERSVRWWTNWADRCVYQGPYRDAVIRSALALKLLSYAPSGAIVAAPTTSLPERLGGDLNWDYRYCWLRDAALTVRSLCDIGYEDEASAFASWLLHTTRLTRPELRVLYDVYGENPKREESLTHLTGYHGSRPVRIRNAASTQLQLDSYGEVVDAVADMCRRGAQLDGETQAMLADIGNYVATHWHLPDQGIWEPRDVPQHHTHSRVLCWVALDRLLRLHDAGRIDRLAVDKLETHRARIVEDVEINAWNQHTGSYARVLGGEQVDASLLLLGWYGFSRPHDPRMRSTYARIVERLGAGRSLLYRNEEKRAEGEAAFGICSMWAVEYLASGGGSLEDAEDLFQQFLPFANDLGLYSEEIDPATGAPLGNFPQAFTHVGLISAALALEERRASDLPTCPRITRPITSPQPGVTV